MAVAVPVAGPFQAVVLRGQNVAGLHAVPAATRLQVCCGTGRLGKATCRSRSGRRQRDFGACRCRGSKGESSAHGDDSGASSSGSNLNSGAEAGTSGWNLAGPSKKMQAAAAKMGDPLRDMMTTASRRLQDYLDNHRQKDKSSPEEKVLSEWERWQRVFCEVEEMESLASAIKFQLEDAVSREDFVEAARLKRTMAALSADDAVAEVTRELERAVQEEKYEDAARLRDKAGAGLVGWWSGLGDGGGDPFGRLVKIMAVQGRFMGTSYTARQLAAGAPGIPVFEVFVTRGKNGEYEKQAVYLQREGSPSAEATASPVKSGEMSVVDIKNLVVEGEGAKTAEDDAPKSDGKEEDSDVNEGLKVIMNFLKDRMPDLKLKVFQVVAPEGAEADIPKIVEQLMEDEEDNAEVGGETSGSGSDDDESVEEGSIILDEKLPSDFLSGNTMRNDGQKDTSIRLLLGGVLPNNGEDKAPRPPVRVPAMLEMKSRDSFVFNLEDNGLPQATSKVAAPSWKVAAIATRASAGLMPDDVAKVLWHVDKVPVKVSKEMGEMIRLAVSQAQRRHGLQKSTSFTRLDTTEASTDPLCGLYIGAFGPYTSEVVQLKRKYGCWPEGGVEGSKGKKLEFFEYVEAVKLTGDLNVPAGQVTFRAKTGRENRLSPRGYYPEELGVVVRYKGEGRLAEPGFRNPHWIDGELIVLDGKSSHTHGAELGFVYSATERTFLVLFNRLRL